MTFLIYAGIFTGGVIILLLVLNGINILQAGRKMPDGRSMKEILGKDPASAVYDDVEALSRKEKMQLFFAADIPSLKELEGEYDALLLSGGILGKSSAMFTHYVFAKGRPTIKTKWVGKAFRSENETIGSGYNIFSDSSGGEESLLRLRKIETAVGPTVIGKDRKEAFLISYKAFNGGTVKSMCDEVRKINDELYIGCGYMNLGGGPSNPAPFMLAGKPRPWVGPDQG